jgi:hypothetical protein
MKIKLFFLTLAGFAMLTGTAYPQGKLVMLNGKEKRFTSAEVKGETIVYQREEGNKTISRKVDKYDVFSILRDNGSEEIIYSPDTVAGLDPTISEVRDYIKGERYAGTVYRKPMNLISGIAVGGAGSMIGFYGLIVPVVYPAILGRFTPKIKEPVTHNYNEITGKYDLITSPETTPNVVITEAFSAGYGKKARNMKIKNSLIGGGLGFAVGITVLALVFNND